LPYLHSPAISTASGAPQLGHSVRVRVGAVP
jgi:hypothetical protein